MFREMRRIKQALPEKTCVEILEKGTSGILGLLGDEGYPYTVPLNYCYTNGKIYFHCAKIGHKIDAIKHCDKASFCVIDKDEIVPEKRTDNFRSIIAFGKIEIVEDKAEKYFAMEAIADKYSPDIKADNRVAIDDCFDMLCVLSFKPEHLSGKESTDLMKKRNNLV